MILFKQITKSKLIKMEITYRLIKKSMNKQQKSFQSIWTGNHIKEIKHHRIYADRLILKDN